MKQCLKLWKGTWLYFEYTLNSHCSNSGIWNYKKNNVKHSWKNPCMKNKRFLIITHALLHVCMQVWIHTYTYVHMYIYMYVHVCMRKCASTFMCMHASTLMLKLTCILNFETRPRSIYICCSNISISESSHCQLSNVGFLSSRCTSSVTCTLLKNNVWKEEYNLFCKIYWKKCKIEENN